MNGEMLSISRLGGGNECNDSAVFYEDGRIVVSLNNLLRGKKAFNFSGERMLAGMLLDYLFTINFFALRNSYDTEEYGRPAVSEEIDDDGWRETAHAIPSRVWEKNSLDSVYIIRANVFGKNNEVSFSYSKCPQKLWSLRKLIDELLFCPEDFAKKKNLLSLVENL